VTASVLEPVSILVATGVVMFLIGWLGARAYYREIPDFGPEPDPARSWPPGALELAAYGASHYPTRDRLRPDYDPGNFTPTTVSLLSSQYWTPPSQAAALPAPAGPAGDQLDPPTRVASVDEIAEAARYSLTWGQLGRQADEAYDWYDRTFQTGQFRAVRDQPDNPEDNG
jgi:hypothetical protein